MKTAVQELIEHIQNNATKFSSMNTYNILQVIEPYLEKEKEQIIDARIDGDENYSIVGGKRYEYAEQYYNETYNQNKS